MKKAQLSCYALLMALLCASCHPEKAEEKVSAVQLEEGRVPWDTLARHLRITGLIPVVSDSLFLAHCDKAVIRGTEVYLLDAVQQALFRTDTRTGRLRPLLHALGRSRAEYLSVTDFDVDPSGRLLVYDSDSRKVNRYSPSGRYLGSLPVRPGTALAAAPGGQLALHTNRLVQDTLVIAYDSTGTPCASAPAWGEEPPLTLEASGSIAAMPGGFVYAAPFDCRLFFLGPEGSRSLVRLDFGPKGLSTADLPSPGSRVDPVEFLKKTEGKVLYLHNLSASRGRIFCSTDGADQLMYDSRTGQTLVLSRAESPYHILFSAPVAADAAGNFCVLLSDNNVRHGLFPLLKYRPTGEPALDSALDRKDSSATMWLLTGRVLP